MVVREVGALRVAIGAAPSTAQGQPIVGLLIVVDAGARVVSILVLSPSFDSLDPFRADVDTILGTLVVRRVEAAASEGRPPADAATRALAIADLAGEWGRHDGIKRRTEPRIAENAIGTAALSPEGIFVRLRR